MKHKIIISILLVLASVLPGWSQLTTMHGTLSGIGIKSLNGLTAKTQTFATGTTGTDFNISSVGTIHTFNIPTASSTNRGLLSSADWTTFNNKFTLPAFTAGSVIFSNGTTLTQDNPNFFWDDTNNKLGIGISTPINKCDVISNALGGLLPSTPLTDGSGIAVRNTTAAAGGAQQSSPGIVWSGNGWSTTSSASQDVSFRAYSVISQGSSPTAIWSLQNSVNGGAYADRLTLTSSGLLTVQNGFISTGAIQTANGATNSVFYATSASSGINSTTSQYLFAGATGTLLRSVFYGNSNSQASNDNNYSAVLIANAPVQTSASGANIHNIFANLVVKPIGTITLSGATLNNTSSLYVEDAATGGTNNYSFWVDAGKSRLDGATGIGGITSPTALLHLAAGTASASTAPLKLTSGTNLTTAEAGAIEYDGTEFYATNSGASRTIISRCLKGSATLDFSSTAAQSSADLTITVTGAVDGDPVDVGAPNGSVNDNTSFFAWVSAANTVTVRFNNYSSGAVDPASGTFKVTVNK